MTGFSGRATAIKGWVALPPGYADGKGSYPTVYSDGGFGSTLDSAKMSAAGVAAMMAVGVFLIGMASSVFMLARQTYMIDAVQVYLRAPFLLTLAEPGTARAGERWGSTGNY